jgi:flagellar basal-body rod modification protein FlgD
VIDPIRFGASGDAASAASHSSKVEPRSSDFQNFLKLLTTQLRNQDPLSPLDSTQFVSQLASFSTVEQLVAANAKLDGIASKFGHSSLAGYADWIGLQAEATGAPAVNSGAPIPYRITTHSNASHIVLVARDEYGVDVSRSPAINSEGIQHWEGPNLPIGRYHLRAEYYDGDDLIASRPASTFSAVENVRLSGDEILLRLASGVEVERASIIGLGGQE